MTDTSKPTNHSILSLTSDLKSPNAETAPPTVSQPSVAVPKVSVPPILLTNILTHNNNGNIAEASPKKKPRKQLM